MKFGFKIAVEKGYHTLFQNSFNWSNSIGQSNLSMYEGSFVCFVLLVMLRSHRANESLYVWR
jgi:hypothetical protein